MSSASEDQTPPEISPLLKEAKAEQIIEELKSARRDEIVTRLTSLLGSAYKKGLNPKSTPQVQQRWFTICAYVSQVMARVLRDLDYEKLRADVEDLKTLISSKVVHSTRGTGYQPRAEVVKEKSRS